MRLDTESGYETIREIERPSIPGTTALAVLKAFFSASFFSLLLQTVGGWISGDAGGDIGWYLGGVTGAFAGPFLTFAGSSGQLYREIRNPEASYPDARIVAPSGEHPAIIRLYLPWRTIEHVGDERVFIFRRKVRDEIGAVQDGRLVLSLAVAGLLIGAVAGMCWLALGRGPLSSAPWLVPEFGARAMLAGPLVGFLSGSATAFVVLISRLLIKRDGGASDGDNRIG
jgi:hypothetical protein